MRAVDRHALFPKLTVHDTASAVTFYAKAFLAVELFRFKAASGVDVAQLSIEGAEFWVSEESREHQNFSPLTLGGATTRMVLIVADPDTTFADALTAGAREVLPVHVAHGWRFGRVVDPFGHHWEICHPTV